MKALYFDCFSGISGDMTLGALLDLGIDKDAFLAEMAKLNVEGFEIKIGRTEKSGIGAQDVDVILTNGEFIDEHHHHEHRSPEDIIHIIGHASMTDSARELACKIVKILANAEAKAHGVPLEQVHFHEVGAVDSIVDIVAAAVCADSLELDEVYIPQLNEGRGMVRCQHGLLPIPVPAVANIISANQLKMHITDVEGELVTPTGAAIAAALRTQDQLPEKFTIQKVGMGAGKREYACVGVLRAMMIE